jgi:hypothetical protein
MDTFEFQTCTCLDEFLTIDLAMAEIEGRKMWHYYQKKKDPRPKTAPEPKIETSGGRLWVFRGSESNLPCYGIGKSRPKKSTTHHWNQNVVAFLLSLQEKLQDAKYTTSDLQILSTHKRNGYVFCGHPKYRDQYWRDWAMIDWGDITSPGQIWCFVVIDCMNSRCHKKKNPGVWHGDVDVKNNVYAVVEKTDYHKDPKILSRLDIFVPIRKKVWTSGDQNTPWERRFYLTEVENIVEPIAVVPNIGGRSKRDYFVVKQRNEWVEMFEQWLDDPPSNNWNFGF